MNYKQKSVCIKNTYEENMKTICGIDCSGCGWKESCKGCIETDGHPFGGECVAAECYKSGGEECFVTYKDQTIKDLNKYKPSGYKSKIELLEDVFNE